MCARTSGELSSAQRVRLFKRRERGGGGGCGGGSVWGPLLTAESNCRHCVQLAYGGSPPLPEFTCLTCRVLVREDGIYIYTRIATQRGRRRAHLLSSFVYKTPASDFEQKTNSGALIRQRRNTFFNNDLRGRPSFDYGGTNPIRANQSEPVAPVF